MTVPSINNQKWNDIITGKLDYEFDFLAVKILLFRLRLAVKKDSSFGNIKNAVEEFRNLFVKTEKLPLAQKDLKKIFGEDVI